MSQVLRNPEISDPPENNDPPKVEISNPEQIKCHADPRFIIFDSPIHNPF